MNNIKNNIDNFVLFQILEERTNIKKQVWIYLFYGIIMYFFLSMNIVANLIGFVYPGYKSYKCIQSKNSKDDKELLVYWVVYSFVNLIELFTDMIIFFIPFSLAALIMFKHPLTVGLIIS